MKLSSVCGQMQNCGHVGLHLRMPYKERLGYEQPQEHMQVWWNTGVQPQSEGAVASLECQSLCLRSMSSKP